MNVSDVLRVTTARKWHSARKIRDGLVDKGLVRVVQSRIRDPKAHFELATDWQVAGVQAEARHAPDKPGR